MDHAEQAPSSVEKGQTKSSSFVTNPEEVEACTDPGGHYWVIDAPSGPKSEGVCRRCKTRTEFDNSTRVRGWDSNRS